MITLHTGKLGVGKTYSATLEVWKQINAGHDCYVNWHIDFTKFYLHRGKSLLGKLIWLWNKVTFGNEKIGKVYYWETMEQLYAIKNGELFFDEAHTEINARNWNKIPPDFVKKLTQSRHFGLNMHFISQHSGQVDVVVKRIANDMFIHKKFGRIMYYAVFDGEKIGRLEDSAWAENTKSDGFGIHIFNKRLAQSYDTTALSKVKSKYPEYNEAPMWDAEKVLRPKPESERTRSFFDHV